MIGKSLVGHWHGQAAICLGVALAAAVALYFTWYRNLPEADEHHATYGSSHK